MKPTTHSKTIGTYAVILAGGVGSRFWPLSRELEPKQFLTLNGKMSLLQKTIQRISPIIAPQNIYIVANYQHKFEIKKQIFNFSIPEANIVFEPEGKNTAAAIGLVAKFIFAQNSEAVMFVFPSDHFIAHKNKFLSALRKAKRIAQQDYLVTLAIPSTKPHTGYGYIKTGMNLKLNTQYARGNTQSDAYRVVKFIEKPDKKLAEKFFKQKNYFWNSGMFAWKARLILEEIKLYLPGLADKLQRIDSLTDINQKIWKKIKPISIDYGILEKSKNVAAVVARDIGWSDLGSWLALSELLPRDKNGNTIQADSIDIGSKNIAIFGNSRLIATIGLKNLIISDTPDALLICDRFRAEEVKKIVKILNQNRRSEASVHKTVKRPWGSYTVLNQGEGFKTKIVEVSPHKRLSLQRHKYRSEHWVVVEGEAKITNGNKELFLKQGESTYIPKKEIHRLENPGETILKIIEVQCGSYLEEDDIERLKDDFARDTQSKT